MSVTSITRRRSPRRSTQLPACSEKIRFGTSATVVSAPICPAEACSASTAVSGSAISEIWSPTSDTACPMKYRRKLTFSRSSGGSTCAFKRSPGTWFSGAEPRSRPWNLVLRTKFQSYQVGAPAYEALERGSANQVPELPSWRACVTHTLHLDRHDEAVTRPTHAGLFHVTSRSKRRG